MRVRLLTDAGLDKIQKEQKENKSFYQQKTISADDFDTFEYPDLILEDSKYPELEDQRNDEDLREVDYRNSLIIGRFFQKNKVPLSLIHDERYMAYLTHFVYFDYMKKRWPITEGDDSSRASSQYTFNRAPCARNGILRLFWPAFLVAQADTTKSTEEFEAKLHFYFRNRLLLDRVLERKYSVNPNMLDLMIRVMMRVPDPSQLTGKNRSGILPKIVQNILTVTSLDVMDRDLAFDIVLKAALDVAAGKYDSQKRSSYSKNIEEAANTDGE